ncbi:MAG TPA: lytic murein transglycosylase [Gammaproteobacteria bacterium]|nr:lytic murein transglycosylase [Gammaproteobacteria bacterium]
MSAFYSRIPLLALFLGFACLIVAGGLHAAEINRKACLAALRGKAETRDYSRQTLDTAFARIDLLERVISQDRHQPEFIYTLWDYLDTRVTPERVAYGRRMKHEYADLLARINADFGVNPQYLLAFWGLETNFGRYFGDIPVLDSLATLACDSRRNEFFTTQFLEALQIIDSGAMRAEEMHGSWAGAMGHTQFLPTTYTGYAIDYDNDGERDLFNSLPDALASSANYLTAIGWHDGERWGREVELPADFNWSLAGLGTKKPISFWREAGVETVFGDPVPKADMMASLLLPTGRHGPAFLVYNNFHVIMKWNRSISYAIAVGYLANRIAGMGKLRADPADSPNLRTETVMEIQRRLNALGFAAGPVDGIVGSQTRGAVEAFQIRHGLPADGYPDRHLLSVLREVSQTVATSP